MSKKYDIHTLGGLKQLREDAAKAMEDGDRKTTGDLGKAVVAAKVRYYNDETLSPGYLQRLLGKKAYDSLLKDQKAAAYIQEFNAAIKEGQRVADDDFPQPPAGVIEAVQGKLKLKLTGEMDEATRNAIIDSKNDDPQVTTAHVNKGLIARIDDQVAAMEKARKATRPMARSGVQHAHAEPQHHDDRAPRAPSGKGKPAAAEVC